MTFAEQLKSHVMKTKTINQLIDALRHVKARLEAVRSVATAKASGRAGAQGGTDALHAWFVKQDHGLYETVCAALSAAESEIQGIPHARP